MAEYDWINELRSRLHKQGDKLMALEGQMLADRMVAEERHRQTESNSKDIRRDVSDLSKLITAQGESMNAIVNGQERIEQRLDNDAQTRIATASALEDAENARRRKSEQPWITPNRVIMTVLGVLGIAAYTHPMN
jgi:hypothetical protein